MNQDQNLELNPPAQENDPIQLYFSSADPYHLERLQLLDAYAELCSRDGSRFFRQQIDGLSPHDPI